MLIKNHSKCDVWLDTRTKIESGSEYDAYENGFDTKNLHADCGSAIIVTEYCERHIKCFGSLSCREDIKEKDKNKMYVIVVEDKDSPIEQDTCSLGSLEERTQIRNLLYELRDDKSSNIEISTGSYSIHVRLSEFVRLLRQEYEYLWLTDRESGVSVEDL